MIKCSHDHPKVKSSPTFSFSSNMKVPADIKIGKSLLDMLSFHEERFMSCQAMGFSGVGRSEPHVSHRLARLSIQAEASRTAI